MASPSNGDSGAPPATDPPAAPAEAQGGRPPEDGRRLSDKARDGLAVIGPDRGLLALASVLALISGVLETVMLYLLASIGVAIATGREVRDVATGPVRLDTSLTVTTLIATVIVGVLIALSIPLSGLLGDLSARASVRLRTRILDGYLSSTLAFRATYREGYLPQLMGEYCSRADQAVLQFATFMVALCTLAVMLLGAFVANPVVATGAVVALGVTFVLVHPFTRNARRDAVSTASQIRSVIGRVAETARLSQEIAAFDVARAVTRELSREVARAGTSLRRVRYHARLIPSLYQYGALGALLVLIGVLSLVGETVLAGIAPLVLLMVRGLTYARQLVVAVRTGSELAPYVETVTAEIDALERHRAPSPGAAEPDRFVGLELAGVGFHYTPGRPVLRDVTLSIAPGEMVGLIGPSGSGKSTLSQLIVRLRAPTEGAITTGPLGLQDVSGPAWSRVTALVPQDSRLIHGTAADNIRFFRDGFDHAQLEAAARGAQLHDEILAFPEGYETVIGEGARGLSGGQRQRLTIARALLHHPQLLVLDEPTSALDARSEQIIARTLAELKGRTTIVLIAHRPATLRLCDRVYRVADGSVKAIEPESLHVT